LLVAYIVVLVMHGHTNIKFMNCVFRCSARRLSETFIILRKVQRHIINSHRSSYTLFLWDFNQT